MQVLPPALAPLGAFQQFIVYKLEPSTKRPGRTEKYPVDPVQGFKRDAQDVSLWMSFDAAARAATGLGYGYGVGFVFTAADPFWFLDVDHAYTEAGWNAVSQQLMADLAGCAVEISSSGDGLHFFGTGSVPPHGTQHPLLGLEFYHEKRFVALTGTSAAGSASHEPAGLAPLVTRYFPRRNASKNDADWWSNTPVELWRGPDSDERLIERAILSKSLASTFGNKACFADLWTADADALGRAFPPTNPLDVWNRSFADAALAQHLAFWTGNNAERIERLMRESALVRDKWDRTGDDYLKRTIRVACSMQTEFLNDAPPAASPFSEQVKNAPPMAGAARVEERTMLHPDDQVEYFAGCCYVMDENKIMTPDGIVIDASRFNATYGGRTFVMDAGNAKTTRKAFEAFTESQVYRFPRADTTCFRPDLPQGTITRDGGRTAVNVWVPIAVERAAGDTSRFWDHLARMFPIENDRLLLMGYMCTIVQHQGSKLQWAPLIQGTTGNGKSMLSRFVREAIGTRYCHSPRAKSLDGDFNAWLDRHTFYNVDEIFISERRVDVLEVLKQMISDDGGMEVTSKGVDSATRRTCGNFIFNTNHRAAMRKDRHDRRIAPFYSNQQQPDDLTRDGLTKEYFADYVDWLKGQGAYTGQPRGYAVIAELLWTWPIPHAYDARKDVRAPMTSSTSTAIVENYGLVEEEILEAIEQGEPGFRGGWVSQTFVTRLCKALNRPLKRDRVTETMQAIGYIRHPGLVDGRPNNLILVPDNARPVLYVRADREDLLQIVGAAKIADAYVRSQGM